MLYENVLIEIALAKTLDFENPVSVFEEFTTADNYLGFVNLTKKHDAIYGDFDLKKDCAGLYPFVGAEMSRIRKHHGFVTEIILTKIKDFDDRIKPLKNLNTLNDIDLDELYKDEGKATDRYHR